MTEVAERHYLEARQVARTRLSGIAVTRRGYGRPTTVVPMIEAGHPMPDAAGLAATEKVLALADGATGDDLVLVLVSGGASANWIAPAAGLDLTEKRAVTQALLRCGASIGEINAVRKHLSRIKGGRLAVQAQPARVVTLAISDVPGDDPAVIGSGPTVPDPTTLADACAIVARYRLDVPPAISRALANPPMNRRSPRTRPLRTPNSVWSPGRPTCFAPCNKRWVRPATNACSSAMRSRARRARSPPHMRASRSSSGRANGKPSSCRAAS